MSETTDQQTNGLSRRQFLKWGARVSTGVLVGKGLSELFGWYTQTPRKVVDTLGQHPDWLEHTAKVVHLKTLQEVKSAAPSYPTEIALGMNGKHVDMTTLMRQSIEQARTLDPTIHLIWDRSGAVTFEELEPSLPTIAGGVGTFVDLRKFPEPVKNKFLALGRTADSFADFLPFEKTFLGSFITSEMVNQVEQLNHAKFSELEPLIKKYQSLSLPINEADKQYFAEAKPIEVKYKGFIAQATNPVAETLSGIRKMVESHSQETGSPVSPSYVIGYLIYKNDGNLFKGLTDAAFFFKVTARNDFETGMFVGDQLDSRRNTEWIQNNLLDINRYASWNSMPGIDSNGVFGKPVDSKLIQQVAALNTDQLNNIRPENATGTLYHLITNLSLCAKLPWEFLSVPSIVNVALIDQGGIKFARELAGLSEFPEVLSFLNSYSKK